MLATFLSSALVSSLGVAALLPVLRSAQVLDVPTARSSHHAPVPRGGGLAVAVGIGAGLLVGLGQGATPSPWLSGAFLVMAVLGFLDDLLDLKAMLRLCIQIAFCWVLSVGLFGISGVEGLLTCIVAAIWLVGFTNAFNFMDGINGISVLNAATAGAWYALIGHQIDSRTIEALGVAVAGASIGFLPWNVPTAKVFLGDVGSYTFGVLLAGLALLSWRGGVPLMLSVGPLVIYLTDTGWALSKRVLGGRSWREAHREHVYQRVADLIGHVPSALTTVAFSVVVLLVLLSSRATPALGLSLLAMLLGLYLAMPSLLGAAIKVARSRE